MATGSALDPATVPQLTLDQSIDLVVDSQRDHGWDYETVLAPILGLAGYLVGWLALSVAVRSPAASNRFHQLPEFVLWRAITAGEVGFWLAILPHAVAWRRKIRQRCDLVHTPGPVEVGVIFTFLALVLVPLLTTPNNNRSPLAHNGVRIAFLYGLATIVGVVIVLGLTGVYWAFKSGHWEDKHHSPQHFLEDLRFLGSYKRRFLAVAGAMISVAVLSAAALQRAVEAYDRSALAAGTTPAPAPSGLLLAYGALFVAVLALIYLPCHVRMRDRGERLLDRCLVLDLSKADVGSQIEKRRLIREELDLKRSAWQTLTDAIIIFSPLLTGGLSLLIAHGK